MGNWNILNFFIITCPFGLASFILFYIIFIFYSFSFFSGFMSSTLSIMLCLLSPFSSVLKDKPPCYNFCLLVFGKWFFNLLRLKLVLVKLGRKGIFFRRRRCSQNWWEGGQVGTWGESIGRQPTGRAMPQDPQLSECLCCRDALCFLDAAATHVLTHLHCCPSGHWTLQLLLPDDFWVVSASGHHLLLINVPNRSTQWMSLSLQAIRELKDAWGRKILALSSL